jgi:hypothetical protein
MTSAIVTKYGTDMEYVVTEREFQRIKDGEETVHPRLVEQAILEVLILYPNATVGHFTAPEANCHVFLKASLHTPESTTG